MNALTRRTGSLFGVVMLGLLLLAGSITWAADQPDDETCLACHDDYNKTLMAGTHRLSSNETGSAVAVTCAGCHTGAAIHADDPSTDNIGNPTMMSDEEVNDVCTSCHKSHLEAGVSGFDPHLGQNLNCVSCHTVHGEDANLLRDDDAAFCGKCHTGILNEFRLRSNHPATDLSGACLSCHDFNGSAEPDYGHGASANCYSCHPEQSGPYMFEHDPTSSFATEGEGGCISCHNPHGSINERLLARPDNSLCRQCHGVPPLHSTTHNGIGSQFDCMECHSEIHGSNDNHWLLDPNLWSKIGGTTLDCNTCHN